MPRVEKDIHIKASSGLHIRPATLLAEAIRPLDCEVYVGIGSNRVNAKSIMGLLTLAAAPGEILLVQADGPDAEKAVKEIEQVLDDEQK